MTNNINKLTKAQLINLLKETEAQLYTCKADSLILSDQLSELQKQYTSLRQHATKQNTEIQQLKAQTEAQRVVLIINNKYIKTFNNKDAYKVWCLEHLHSYNRTKSTIHFEPNSRTMVIGLSDVQSKQRQA